MKKNIKKIIYLLIITIIYIIVIIFSYNFLNEPNNFVEKCNSKPEIKQEKECYKNKKNKPTITTRQMIKNAVGYYHNVFIPSQEILFVKSNREMATLIKQKKFINYSKYKILKENKNTIIKKQNTFIDHYVLKQIGGIAYVKNFEYENILNSDQEKMFIYLYNMARLHPFEHINEDKNKTTSTIAALIIMFKNSTMDKEEFISILNKLIIYNYNSEKKYLVPSLFILLEGVKNDYQYLQTLHTEDVYYFAKYLTIFSFQYNYFTIIEEALDNKFSFNIFKKMKRNNDYYIFKEKVKEISKNRLINYKDMSHKEFLYYGMYDFDFGPAYKIYKEYWKTKYTN